MNDINKETVIKAKKKLRAHLERYHHEEEFVITDRKIRYWFGVINKAMFKNELPQPSFNLRSMKNDWGQCLHQERKQKVIISIDNSIDSRALFLATLAHEMVHLWQIVFESRMTHGLSYLKWKRLFKKKFNITL